MTIAITRAITTKTKITRTTTQMTTTKSNKNNNHIAILSHFINATSARNSNIHYKTTTINKSHEYITRKTVTPTTTTILNI